MNYEQWLAPEFYNITSEMENHDPGKTALKWLSEQGDYEEISYGDLLAGANRLAGGLSGLGLNKGDRVLVMMPRHINAYVIYVACLKLGLTIIPSSEMLRAKDLAYRLRHPGRGRSSPGTMRPGRRTTLMRSCRHGHFASRLPEATKPSPLQPGGLCSIH